MLKGWPLLSPLVIAVAVGCSSPEKHKENSEKPLQTGSITVIADTVIYDVLLRNIDTSDAWGAECLQYLNQALLVDYLMAGVYSGQLVAVEFMGNRELSLDEVRAIEASKGFSRDRVSKVQFRERWYIDPDGQLQKEIISYTLGLEVYSKQHSFLGHQALFVVKPKP